MDRGSNGVPVLSAWALFSSRVGGALQGGGVRCAGRGGAAYRVPPALSRCCPRLDPYLPWGSNGVGPQHREPRSRALAYCCQHSSSYHPAPFLRTPLPRGWQPAHAPTSPARCFSQQKPCPPGPQRAGDSAGGRVGGRRGGGGVFSFPPDSPFHPHL